MLLVEYSLPNADAMTRLKEAKYIQSRDEFIESFLADSAFEKLYDGALYKIALRSIHELIKSDEAGSIDSIVFNGRVRAVEPPTGQETNGCILSLQIDKAEFACINLAKAGPKACFKKLKGVGSSKLAALVPIRPILQLNSEDERFVPSYKVVDTIDSTMNLAAMDWEDFEHLIREVFEVPRARGGHMLQFQFAAQELLAAILANVSVPKEDVLPRECLDPRRQTPILAKANDTRQLQPDMHIPIVRLFGDSNTLDEQHEGAACPRNVHRLIARIEH